MDIDTILKRGDFQIPLFSEFILNKYEDLKHLDPQSADTIEQQVFTPGFLKNILENGDRLLKSNVLELVPAEAFASLASDIESLINDGLLPGRSGVAARVFRAVAPERFLESMAKKSREFLPLTSDDAFSWQPG